MSRRPCPKCGKTALRHIGCVTQSDGVHYTRRKCKSCNHIWNVYELDQELVDYFRMLSKNMKHVCPNCDNKKFKVVATFGSEDHTLRQRKCSNCGENIFTREYIMEQQEFCWQLIGGKQRMKLRKP